MIKENLKMTGSLEIAINGDTVCKTNNLVVTAGKEHVTARLKDNATDGAMSSMAIGTSSANPNDTAPNNASGQTALGSEAARDTFDSGADTSGANSIKFITTFDAVGSGSDVIVTEAGIFNHATTGGTMLARTVFGAVTKGANDVMTITWTITVS